MLLFARFEKILFQVGNDQYRVQMLKVDNRRQIAGLRKAVILVLDVRDVSDENVGKVFVADITRYDLISFFGLSVFVN